MDRARFVPVWCVALTVQIVWAGSSVLHAQRRLAAQPIQEARAVFLGERETHELYVDGTGAVFLGSSGPVLVRVGLDDSVSLQALKDFGFYGPHGDVLSISSDGALLAGSGSSNALYFEGMWWAADAPLSPHGIGGNISQILGIENTPSGRVMVGGFDGVPFDIRPGGGLSVLPGLPQINGGSANGLSADGRVYCGSVGQAWQAKAVRWVDRVPEALDDPDAQNSSAVGVSDDGTNFAGLASVGGVLNAVVWLAQDGLALRPLQDSDGSPLQGTAFGVMDDGFTYGESWGSPRFGWIWHPSSGSDRVTRFEDWLALFGLAPIDVESVHGVRATKKSYHFSLTGGSSRYSWYVQTPKNP